MTMKTLLDLDNQMEMVYDHRNILSPSTSSSGGDSNAGLSSVSSPASDYSRNSDSVFNMDSLYLTKDCNMESDYVEPFLEILVQPIDKFRFRYKSEMHGTHGSLMGQTTNKVKRVYPTVRLHNFQGPAIIRCSLYQANPNQSKKLHHSHTLMVRKGNEDIKDPHVVEISPTRGNVASFEHMGIIHTAKKNIVEELHNKLVQQAEFEKSREITELENMTLQRRAEDEAKQMNLNQVCLCFEAYHFVDGKPVRICEPVLSTPINNMKSALTGELKITRLSKDICEASGGEDLFLFVEKVGKKNIKVRFFETDENDEPIWEADGKFTESDVHHQYAIALRTPPYLNQDIEDNVNCWIQLVRPSDKCYSDRLPFRYKPRSSIISRKRARMHSNCNSAELLPATLHQNETISKEFNKSAILADMLSSNKSLSDSLDLANIINSISSSEMNSLINYSEGPNNYDEIMKLVDNNIVPSYLQTDCTGAINESSNFEPLFQFIRKVQLTQPKDKAAEFLRAFFIRQYENDRCTIHDLISSDGKNVKKLLQIIKDLEMNDLLDLQNNQSKTCFHAVSETVTNVDVLIELLTTLIRLGANPNLQDDKGNTVLHTLIAEGYTDCVKTLLANAVKLDLEIQNDDSLTPLLYATRLGQRDHIVRLLLDAKASVNAVNSKDGNTALHMAVIENSNSLANIFLGTNDIDVSRKNNCGKMAIDLAQASDLPNEKLIALLMSKSQLSENTLCTNIKEEPNDEEPELMICKSEDSDAHSIDAMNLLDDICLEQLCEFFNKADKWKKLARYLDYEPFINVWASSKNPSKMLFKFSEVQGTELKLMIDVFQQLNEPKAIICIDEMITRRLESDDQS